MHDINSDPVKPPVRIEYHYLAHSGWQDAWLSLLLTPFAA
jgi:hypothetical protein